MAIDGDDEILQDFLVEAEEILEQLGEQLVELEQDPESKDLLNSVFRGFHTIKGGAGFLNITPLVTICHRAEDVFNLLRQGERKVDAQLMDIILKVLDIVNGMFNDVRQGEMPAAADSAILQALEKLAGNETPAAGGIAGKQESKQVQIIKASSDNTAVQQVKSRANKPAESGGAESDEITDDEFEALLDEIHGEGKHCGIPAVAQQDKTIIPAASATGAEQPKQAATPDQITDDEFERLLDDLHGTGKHGGIPNNVPAVSDSVQEQSKKAVSSGSDEITEDEFEALLDNIHGTSIPGASVNAKKVDIKPGEKAQPRKEAAPPQAETSVRVDTKRLDEIMNLVGELVLLRNRIKTFELTHQNEELGNVVANIDLVTSDLQASVMKTRMQPIKKVFGRFPRVVRDLARSLNKEISLELRGEDTDLDKNLVEALADPLVHLVRNAVDHGIEVPDVREAAGKSRTGKVILSAEQEGDHILLTITDDGAGMNPDKLREIAVEKGLMDEAAAQRLDDRQCYQLIFAPGFSTKSEISDISGRGVGMDVVKTRITQLNGSIVVDSEQRKGSSIAIKVPLTLAIMPTLMIMLSRQVFALPLVNVVEIFNLDLSKTNIVDGQLVVIIRDRPLPIFYLNKWLVNDTERNESSGYESGNHVVVVNVGTQHIGFVVDRLIGQEEVVIKPLGALLQGTKGIAGATITGSGRISLILDVPGLMMAYAKRM